ncbi:MAG: helix-turn-helix domain-containing protein [Rhodoplanes sp.]|uniref:helix-turn-helix domain-containing protein n=1 Tax=Rhodoplanes sp. TaxID=1968906 RepID=UPI00184876C9|nr:helix-turn-helix domain-containing protein [Rhodoplanes sp.]NVO16107.1 helix-turn-helix domain-containing protein [Rhodoplanes sp.]
MDEAEDVDRVITGMKLAFDVELDRELAEKLGIDPTSVASWRRRGQVPAKYRIRLSRIFGDQVPAGSVNRYLCEAYIFSLVRLAAIRLGEEIKIYEETDYAETWYGFRLARFYHHIRRIFAGVDPNNRDELRAAFGRVRKDIDQPGFSAWIEALPNP